jgi:aryl-alcohol dehydrogenase-like predicted oxidoreductase
VESITQIILENAHFSVFEEQAKKHGVSRYAITIAWHLATSAQSIPIPGATRKESILDNVTGLSVNLSADDLAALNDSLPTNVPLDELLVPQPPFRS